MTFTAANFKYISFNRLREIMDENKRAAFNMIPESQRYTAQFVGYAIECKGNPKAKLFKKCDFKVPYRQEVTKDMHEAAINHFFEHDDHELTIHVDFDFTAWEQEHSK